MILSIIVPIYNAEKYLKRCIDSLLAQGLNEGEYEILLINDGSKDNSLNICQEYKNQYPSIIRLYSHHNQGVSFTRNKGIQEAEGNYIAFVDADDYLIPNGYKYLTDNYLDSSIDILSFWALTLDKKTKANYIENYQVDGKIDYEVKGIDFLKRGVQTFIWSSLYKRDFINKHQIRFSSLSIGEDVLFNIDLYLKNPLIRMVTSRIYRYDLHEESVIHQRDYKSIRKGINSYKTLIEAIYNHYKMSNNIDLKYGLQNIIKLQIVPLVSRLLSSNYSIDEFKCIRSFLIEKDIIPLKENKKKSYLINYIFRYAF